MAETETEPKFYPVVGENEVPVEVHNDVDQMLRQFVQKAVPNVMATRGKAKLSLKLGLAFDGKKKRIVLDINGGITLCAGRQRYKVMRQDGGQLLLTSLMEEPK